MAHRSLGFLGLKIVKGVSSYEVAGPSFFLFQQAFVLPELDFGVPPPVPWRLVLGCYRDWVADVSWDEGY